ncbi:type III-B CRISPR module RAMP protein Cmr6 [bacterium]|nr:type III-B CRISPR module RAMP protein Cmr6 [bacterium]
MPAAVPAYVGQGFDDCPPGHRFNLYFPIWRDDWSADKTGKAEAIRACTPLSAIARSLLSSLRERQLALAEAMGALTLEARSLAPFATGLGLEHPVENGFAFLSPYGLPYLAGSGAKGVFRRAAQELSCNENAPLTPTDVDILFGPEDTDEARRGALNFWDVFPDCPALSVEIMTPHHGNYYQQGGTPNDAGQPNPIPFLAVPPGAAFRFIVGCDTARLPEALAPRWRDIVTTVFLHACDWRGFGAKTAVGYGAIELDEKAQARREEARKAATKEAARAAALAAMTPNLRKIEEFRAFCTRRAEQLMANKEAANAQIHTKARELAKAASEGMDWTVEEKCAVAHAIEEWLPKLVKVDMKDERKKMRLAALRGQTQ